MLLSGTSVAKDEGVDRIIEVSERRTRAVRRGAIVVAVVAVVAISLVAATGWITPSVARARIRTARVDTGALESTIAASGLVVPEVEGVISSPVSTRVLRVLKRPGDVVSRGDAILELDVSESRLAVENLDQDLALKQNAQAQTRLELEKTLSTLESGYEIKRLELESLESKAEQRRKLSASGVLSSEALREAELAASTASIQLREIEKSRANAREATATRLAGLDLEIDTLRRERTEAQRKLDLATTEADRDGVLTWVVADEGAAVAEGTVLARIADLSAFRVEATISDVHAERLSAGLPVKIKVGEVLLDGTIASVLPTIKDGTVTALVALADRASSLLHANLRVDVLVVADHRDHVLRVDKGPFVTGGNGTYEVFVVRGDRAVRVPVRLGITGMDDYEVLDGLAEGDEVIVSDMTGYLHASEIRLT